MGNIEASSLGLLLPVFPLCFLESGGGPVWGILAFYYVKLGRGGLVIPESHHRVTGVGTCSPVDNVINSVKPYNSKEVAASHKRRVQIDKHVCSFSPLETSGMLDKLYIQLLYLHGDMRVDNRNLGVGCEGYKKRGCFYDVRNKVRNIVAEAHNFNSVLVNDSLVILN